MINARLSHCHKLEISVSFTHDFSICLRFQELTFSGIFLVLSERSEQF